HQGAGLEQVTAGSRADLLVSNPGTNCPLQDVGILVLAQVDMRQHEPTWFDRVFHDREGPSRVRPGYLEHDSHTAEPNRTALARLYDKGGKTFFTLFRPFPPGGQRQADSRSENANRLPQSPSRRRLASG